MPEKSKLQRRDFLKLGGLMALSAPAANVIGKIGDHEIVESKEEFGGFAIRRHTQENPPYDLDESIYQRHDVRRSLDALKMNIQMDSGLIKLDAGDYTRYDSAFHNASWLLAMGLGTNGTQTDAGLFSWHQIPNADGPGIAAFHELPRWEPAEDGLPIEDVTAMIKKAAKFYGASLVGIAPMDERWFYSKVYNVDLADLLDDATSYAADAGVEVPVAGKVSGRDIVQEAFMAMDKNELKDMIIQVSTDADPTIMPEGVTVGALRAMPAGMFQKMLPNVIRTFSPEYLVALADGIPTNLMPDDFDPRSILDEDFEIVEIYESIPSATVEFHDGDDNYLDGELGVDGSQYLVSRKMKWVIVMAFEMDPDGIDTEHGHVPEAAVAMGYSRMATTAGTLATFIRNLGYHAIPMGNDTSLSVPFAIHAGLGELSRAGWMITPKYGPRVRLAKVATDLPLIVDQPITFGVSEFCEICGKCAESCPSGAISIGERTYEAPHTGNPGVFKWAANGGKCQQYWSDMGTSCSMCLTACPFTKPEGWLHDATRILVGAKSGTLDKILLKLDGASGYGKGLPSRDFWNKDNFMHIKES